MPFLSSDLKDKAPEDLTGAELLYLIRQRVNGAVLAYIAGQAEGDPFNLLPGKIKVHEGSEQKFRGWDRGTEEIPEPIRQRFVTVETALRVLRFNGEWLAANWLHSPHPDLKGLPPAEALRQDHVAEVVLAARSCPIVEQHPEGLALVTIDRDKAAQFREEWLGKLTSIEGVTGGRWLNYFSTDELVDMYVEGSEAEGTDESARLIGEWREASTTRAETAHVVTFGSLA